jgi:hypothetical protein
VDNENRKRGSAEQKLGTRRSAAKPEHVLQQGLAGACAFAAYTAPMAQIFARLTGQRKPSWGNWLSDALTVPAIVHLGASEEPSVQQRMQLAACTAGSSIYQGSEQFLAGNNFTVCPRALARDATDVRL